MSTITRAWPSLSYRDANGAIEFLTSVFGFQAPAVYEDGGVVRHAELVWKGAGVVMLGQTPDEDKPTCATGRNSVYLVADSAAEVDAIYERAKEAGAAILLEPTDQPYGSHEISVAGPEGNAWNFGTYRGTS